MVILNCSKHCWKYRNEITMTHRNRFHYITHFDRLFIFTQEKIHTFQKHFNLLHIPTWNFHLFNISKLNIGGCVFLSNILLLAKRIMGKYTELDFHVLCHNRNVAIIREIFRTTEYSAQSITKAIGAFKTENL